MKKSRLLVGLVMLLVACSSDTRETPKGFKFSVIRNGDGKLPRPGQFLELTMTHRDNDDSIWTDTREQELPWIVAIQDSAAMAYEESIDGIFRMLSKGDSIMFKVTIKEFFEKAIRQPIPPGIDSTGTFTFHIGVNDVYSREQVDEIQKQLVEKQNSEYAAQLEQQLGIDTLTIDSHLDEKGIVANKTQSGLRYVVTKKGKGPLAQPGQMVSVNYTGYLLDGTFFETSVESVAREKGKFQEGRPYQPYTLEAGPQGRVIDGWKEALLLMNKGSKMTIYIPSTLAYGAQGSGIIPENSVLVFDLELVDIK